MTATDATLDGLLRDVIAYPDDDVVRLIMADRLEELGQEARAEFIRVQCELSRLDRDSFDHVMRCWKNQADDARSWMLVRRQGSLLRTHSLGWLPRPLIDLESANGHVVFDYRRGFAEVATLSAADWLMHADALTAATPLREVRLTGRITVGVGGLQWEPGYCWLMPVTWPRNTLEFGGLEWHRPKRLVKPPSELPEWLDHTHIPALLASEWPNITFTLPEREP